MDRYSHTESDEKDSSKQNDTRIPKKASPDFFSKTTDLSPGKNNEDFGRKLLDLYKQRRLLQQQKESLSKQTDEMLRTRISSPFPTINHAFPDLKLHDLPELTKEGVYIPGCDTKQPYKKDEERHQTAFPLRSELQKSIDRTFGSSKNMNDNIDQIAVSVHDVSSDFYYNSVPKESKNIFNSGLKANHFNHVYIYYNICERIFTNKSASFDPGVVQQTQKEFRERRNLLEQSIGFPDVQNLLEQESPKNKGFISENMHKDLKDEYNRIESQGYYYKSRLEDLGELRGKFHSAQKVYEFLGVRADYEVPTKTLQEIQSSHELSENTLTPEEIQLSHDLSERIQNVANESRWDKAMEKVTEVIADEYINTDLRMRVAETVGVIGSSTSSIETRRPIAEHLVGLLDKEKIDKYVGMSVAETVGVIREQSVMPTLIKLLDREGIHSRVRMRVAETVGVIGNNMSSVNERRPIAERLVGLLGEERIDPNVRHSIAKAVGVIGEPSVIPDLVELRGKESIDLYVRMSVAETVAALQNRQLHET